MKCSALPPRNESCYGTQTTEQMEQCERCLRVFCYCCIQQHSCVVDPLRERSDVADVTRRVMQQINACTPGARLAEVPTLFAFGPIYKVIVEEVEAREALQKEVKRLQVARIGDSETIGRFMSQVEKLEQEQVTEEDVDAIYDTAFGGLLFNLYTLNREPSLGLLFSRRLLVVKRMIAAMLTAEKEVRA